MNEVECPVCKSKASVQTVTESLRKFYECPVCGRYELDESWETINANHLASYLFYNSFKVGNCKDYRYHTTLDKEKCDTYRQEFKSGNNTHGLPVHMDNDIVEAWYPKTFAERVDEILLYLSNNTPHLGQTIALDYQSILSLLFVDRKCKDSNQKSKTYGKAIWRNSAEYTNEMNYMLKYLKEKGLLDYVFNSANLGIAFVQLKPDGYSRVDDIQKRASNGCNALVAMQFGDATKALREAIRLGITNAGYNAVFIDEVQHNDFITPEILKYIRDSKFVVADLTHQNNGAYFEEGYAMGLGKPVIQLCKDGTKLHFDIAQKNTIMWETEADIPERLCNRIKATID